MNLKRERRKVVKTRGKKGTSKLDTKAFSKLGLFDASTTSQSSGKQVITTKFKTLSETIQSWNRSKPTKINKSERTKREKACCCSVQRVGRRVEPSKNDCKHEQRTVHTHSRITFLNVLGDLAKRIGWRWEPLLQKTRR